MNGPVYGIVAQKESVSSEITNIKVNSNSNKSTAYGILINSIKKMDIERSEINVNSDAKAAYGISNANKDSKMSITNTNVFADAEGSSVDTSYSIGISNYGELIFYSGSIYGLHSGITNRADAKLYVYGGTFDGYGHGGIYFAQGENGEAYIENATIKSGEYKGKHDESKFSLAHGGSFYIGGGTAANNSNNKVYMNGCTITSVSGTMGVLRGSDGETNNQLYISNSTIESGKKMRIDENQKLFVGKGTNITEANVSSVDRVEFTNEEYKR